eukprot:9226024-Pyramimonas_sp.AAC.2
MSDRSDGAPISTLRQGRYVMASLPLKCLVNADLNENYVLHLDELGNIVAMDYTTPSGECIMEEVAPPEEYAHAPVPPVPRARRLSHRPRAG